MLKRLIGILLFVSTAFAASAQYKAWKTLLVFSPEIGPLAAVKQLSPKGVVLSTSNEKGRIHLKKADSDTVLLFSSPEIGGLRIWNLKNPTKEVYLRNDTLIFERLSHSIKEVNIRNNIQLRDLEQKKVDVQQFGSNNIEDALNRTPGVQMLNHQISLRAGSGYTIGAASRTQVLLDGMPILIPFSGDIRWTLVPNEAIGKIDVQFLPNSAASSSGAINGIVDFKYNDDKTRKIRLYQSFYDNPPKGIDRTWTGRNPMISGLDFNTGLRTMQWLKPKQSIKLMAFGNLNRDEGYREGEFSYRGRVGGSFVWTHSTMKWDSTGFVPRKLGIEHSFQLNGLILRDSTGLFFFWKSYSEAYKVIQSAVHPAVLKYFLIDPSYKFEKSTATRTQTLAVRNRYFYTGDHQLYSSVAYVSSVKKYTFQAGGDHQLVQVVSSFTRNISMYADAEMKKHFANYAVGLGGGIRYALYASNVQRTMHKPMLRAHAFYADSIRSITVFATWAQTWRTPNLIETQAQTVGGQFNLFPNQFLRPEFANGFELKAEKRIAENQSLQKITVALFQNRYQDMIDLKYGIFIPSNLDTSKTYNIGDFLGARSENVYAARITGFQVIWDGNFELNAKKKMYIGYLAEYTYANPIYANLKADTADKNPYRKYLKYRTNHVVRLQVFFKHQGFTYSINTRYTSFMKNMDQEILTYVEGVKTYRLDHPHGDFWTDIQVSKSFSSNQRTSAGWEVALIVRNLFNVAYMPIPGNMAQPRSIGIQGVYRF